MFGDPSDREILRLALPALGALVAEPLFLLVDAAIVGHLGAAPLAGLGIAGAALSTAVNVCVFLAYGTTGSVARLLGAGDPRGAVQQGVNGMWLALFLGLLLTAAVIPLAPAVVAALAAPADAAGPAATYLRIAACGLPGMLIVLAGTGTLRGLYAVRAPLTVAVAGAAANAALNWLLVYPVGLGIAGSALGTAATQVGMAAAYVVITVRMVRRHTASPWPHWAGIRSAGTAAVPLFVRTLALRVYLLVATWLAARSGTTAVAAHTLASQVWNLLALLLDALAIAAQAIVARALGASELAAVRAVLRRLLRWALALGVLGGAAVLVAAPVIGPLFTGDGRVRATLTSLLVIVALFQPVNAVVFLWDGVLIGAGDGPYLAVAGILTTIGFLVAAAVSAALGGGVVGLWWAIGVYMLARLLALGARIRRPSWLVTGAASRTRPARDAH